jgi:lysophospholipase L1-like esterase
MLSVYLLDPDFNSHHFSAWGRQLAQDCNLIQDMVATYNPDYLLVLLGFNDVGWFVSDAEGTFESMKTFIKEARAAKPDIKMALGNIPQRSFLDGRSDLPFETDKYNKMLASAIPWLSMY